jgi:O-antigen ligase
MQNQTSSDRFALHFLAGLLILRIASYFMWSDDLFFAQAVKAVSRIGLSVITATALLFLLRHRNAFGIRINQPMPVWLYAMYLGLGAASMLWTSSLSSSMQQWLMDLEGFVFALAYMALLQQYRFRNPDTNLGLPVILFTSVIAIGILFEAGLWFQPELFYRYTHGGAVARLGGFIINPNELGMLLVIGIASGLLMLVKEGRYRVRVLLALLFLTRQVMLTGSRSSLVALVLVMLVYGFSRGSLRLRMVMSGSVLLLTIIAGLTFFVKQGDWNEVFSLTGRLPFWQDLLTFNFPREPWLGYGYMRIDYADKFESLHAYAGAMTHNTFLQVLLGLGIIGLMLVLVQMLAFVWSVQGCRDEGFRTSTWLLFLPLLINSLTEFGIFGETNYGILFYLLLVIASASEPLRDDRRIRGINHHESPIYRPGRSFAAS